MPLNADPLGGSDVFLRVLAALVLVLSIATYSDADTDEGSLSLEDLRAALIPSPTEQEKVPEFSPIEICNAQGVTTESRRNDFVIRTVLVTLDSQAVAVSCFGGLRDDRLRTDDRAAVIVEDGRQDLPLLMLRSLSGALDFESLSAFSWQSANRMVTVMTFREDDEWIVGEISIIRAGEQ